MPYTIRPNRDTLIKRLQRIHTVAAMITDEQMREMLVEETTKLALDNGDTILTFDGRQFTGHEIYQMALEGTDAEAVKAVKLHLAGELVKEQENE